MAGHRPWTHLAVDICGPFPSGEFVIVLVDYYSKWPEAIITKDISSQKIIWWLESIFISKGYPDYITSDNGTQFTSTAYKTYLDSIGAEPHYVTPYWPQANGLVERLNRTFLKAFRAAVIEGASWKSSLDPFLMAYRTTPHVTTGKTPALLLYGRELKTKLPSFKSYNTEDNQIRKKVTRAQVKQKQYADLQRKTKSNTLKIGDKVLLKRLIYKNKLESSLEPRPATILDVQGGHLRIRTQDGIIIHRNVNQVKKVTTTGNSDARTDAHSVHIPAVRDGTAQSNKQSINLQSTEFQALSEAQPVRRKTRSTTGTVINKPKRYRN